MTKFFFPIFLLIHLLLNELAHAENDNAQNLLYIERNIFDFLLINYANITLDVIDGNGEYLDALYEYSQCHEPKYIFKSLKDTLSKPHSIPDFSRYIATLLNCK